MYKNAERPEPESNIKQIKTDPQHWLFCKLRFYKENY